MHIVTVIAPTVSLNALQCLPLADQSCSPAHVQLADSAAEHAAEMRDTREAYAAQLARIIRDMNEPEKKLQTLNKQLERQVRNLPSTFPQVHCQMAGSVQMSPRSTLL